MAGLLYNYGRPSSTAKRLVTRFGTDAELRRGPTDYKTHVVFTDYRASAIDGTRIKAGDFMGLIAAADCAVEPQPGDALFWDGREREVVNVSVTKPGPTAVLYTLQLRGVR